MNRFVLLLAGCLLAMPAVSAAEMVSVRALCLQHVDGLKDVKLLSGSAKNPILTPVKLFTTTYSDQVSVPMDGGKKMTFVVEEKNEDGEDVLKIVAEGPLSRGNRQLALFIPAPEGSKTPYRLKVIDESEAKFPMGSTLIFNLSTSSARFMIGEHRKELKPGELGLIPLATQTNDFNQCTVRVFVTSRDGEWTPVSSTAWMATREMRSLALTYIHPRSKKPMVQCIQETPPWKLPQL